MEGVPQMRENKITALYQRISKDDGEDNVSNSIKNQKAQLEEYAKSHGFKNIVSFVDNIRLRFISTRTQGKP